MDLMFKNSSTLHLDSHSSFFSIWEEDEKSDGNGMECIVKIKSKESVETYLEKAGSVPIPPYLQREEEMTDKKDYNNAYAANAGSVAAPTAGEKIPFCIESARDMFCKNLTLTYLHQVYTSLMRYLRILVPRIAATYPSMLELALSSR